MKAGSGSDGVAKPRFHRELFGGLEVQRGGRIIMLSLRFWLFFPAILLLAIGCQKRETQYEMEARAGRVLSSLLGIYDVLGNPRCTNLAQVYTALGSPYPHDWDRNFRKFGGRAGFTNSFFEKYIFLPSGATNRWIVGEIVMMNARPYESINHQECRGIFSRIGAQYGWNELSEKLVQELFRDADIPEPKPSWMPPPPPEPINEFSREFGGDSFLTRLSNMIIFWGTSVGLGGSGAIVLRHVVFFSPFVLLPLLGFWLWRRSRR